MKPGPVRIMGLDPGLRKTGWGVIESQGNRLTYVAHGVVSTTDGLDLASRLRELYAGLAQVLSLYTPHEAAVEETFVNKNPVSTLKLGMARGIVLFAPAQHLIPVWEYSANRVKKSVVGAGHADKTQVALMVHRLLPQATGATADGADALATAICHAHYRTSPGALARG